MLAHFARAYSRPTADACGRRPYPVVAPTGPGRPGVVEHEYRGRGTLADPWFPAEPRSGIELGLFWLGLSPPATSPESRTRSGFVRVLRSVKPTVVEVKCEPPDGPRPVRARIRRTPPGARRR